MRIVAEAAERIIIGNVYGCKMETESKKKDQCVMQDPDL